jgi:hypothetical protein
MSSRFFDGVWRWALAAVVVGALPVLNAPGAGIPPAGQQIEFSRPTSANDVISTNLSPFKPVTDAVPPLEQRQQGTFDFLSPQSSMEGLPVPVPQYIVIPNRRLHERLERQKNWASMTPEEILLDGSTPFSTSSSNDSPDSSDRRRTDKHSRSDYPDGARQPGIFSPDSPGDSDWSSASRKRDIESGSRDEAELPADIKAAEKQLRDIQKAFRGETDSGPFSTTLRANTGFSDFFGSSGQKSSWLDQAAHNKALMDQFKQTIQSPLKTPLFPGPALSGSFGMDSFESTLDSNPGFGGLNAAPLAGSPFSPSDGLASPSTALLPLPAAAPDAALAAQSSLSAQPRLQTAPQPSAAPAPPTFVFPKRAFQ